MLQLQDAITTLKIILNCIEKYEYDRLKRIEVCLICFDIFLMIDHETYKDSEEYIKLLKCMLNKAKEGNPRRFSSYVQKFEKLINPAFQTRLDRELKRLEIIR